MSEKVLPALRTPRVAFVFTRKGRSDNSTLYGGFVKRIQKNGGLKDIEAEYFALEELIFSIDGHEAHVSQPGKKYELGDFDFVYIKSWSQYVDRAAALANFLDAKGIPYADTLLRGKGTSKLTTHFRLWKEGIPVIKSVFGSAKQLIAYDEKLEYPVVIKAVSGQKGRDNYLVRDSKERDTLLKLLDDGDFIIQPMIENDGDFRVQSYGYQSRLILKRVGSGESHLNNTSAGGTASLVSSENCPVECDLAERAARAMQLEVCGVDVITDRRTNLSYVMEVNQGSQIVTGLYNVENMRAFSSYIDEVSSTRYILGKGAHKNLLVIGRHAVASLPLLQIDKLPAKIDTGAHVSSLHAENIHVEEIDGKRILRFELSSQNISKRMFETEEFGEINIRNAHGVTKRFTIKTEIIVNGVRAVTKLNLSNRGELKFPLLLGRTFLRGRFLVNVEISKKVKKI